MRSFCTYASARREPAKPMQPVVDPAGWTPADVRDVSKWSYRFTESEIDDLIGAIAAFRRSDAPLEAIGKNNFPLRTTAELMEDARRELLDGRGIIRLRGFPVERLSREDAIVGYMGLSSYVGVIEPQNKLGHLIGHVKNFRNGRTEDDPRGYQSYLGSSFHVDSTDIVALLCIHEAKSGGESRIASTVTVYNRILAERPDLIECLMMDFYKSRYGEEKEGEKPWYKTPIFAFVDGWFSALGYGAGFDPAQKLPGVPPFTEKQKEAKPIFQRIVEECSVDMPFALGDIQYLNNYVTVHARHTFEDWPEIDRRRHLLRLWLNDPVGRPIPEGRLERRNRGLYLQEVKKSVPLELSQAL